MTQLNAGDRALTPLWPDRPVVVDSLKPDTPPVLGFDCTIRLEDCGQRLPYRLAQLTPIPDSPGE